MATPKTLRIGVFIPHTVQLLDLSPIDIFYMQSPEYLTACSLPPSIISLGTPCEIHYITLPSPTSEPHITLTAAATLKTTATTQSPTVQPGLLDIILVPGPAPDQVFGEEELKFLRGHAARNETDILSVCTGCFLVAESGVLKEREASGPRALVGTLRKRFPETDWDEGRRWVSDGNVWSSGGITNGQEMVAAYLRKKYPGPASEAAIAMADVGDKGVEYSKSRPRETLWWLWQILRSLTVGNGKRKEV